MRPPRTRARGEPSFLLSLVLTGVLVGADEEPVEAALEALLLLALLVLLAPVLVLELFLVEAESVGLVELPLVVPALVLRVEEPPVEMLDAPEVVELAAEETALDPEVDAAKEVLALALALPWY